MASSCDSEGSFLASRALQVSKVRFSSEPQLRIPPVRLPISCSKPQDVRAPAPQDWSPGARSGRGLLLGCVCFRRR